MARTLQRRLIDDFDWPLFLSVAVIATIGVMNLYSATSARTGALSELYIQQIYWLAVGAGAATIIASVDYRVYERYAYGAYVATIAALILVFLLGKSIRGTHRWIQIGSFLFQPSEFMKLSLLLAVSRSCSRAAASAPSPTPSSTRRCSTLPPRPTSNGSRPPSPSCVRSAARWASRPPRRCR